MKKGAREPVIHTGKGDERKGTLEERNETFQKERGEES